MGDVEALVSLVRLVVIYAIVAKGKALVAIFSFVIWNDKFFGFNKLNELIEIIISYTKLDGLMIKFVNLPKNSTFENIFNF